MESGKEISRTKEWTSVNIPIEYVDYILEALKKRQCSGCVSEFVRDAIREKLAESRIETPKYDTVLERYEMIPS